MKIRFLSLLGAVLLIAMFGHALRSQADLRLDIARTNSNLVLTWTNTGAALESSLVLPGAWSEITGAVSPRVFSPTNLASFFRLRATNTPATFDFRYVAPTFSSSIGDPFGCVCTSPENPNTLGTVGGAQDNGMGSVLLETGELTQDSVALEIPGRGFNWRFALRYRSGMSYDGPAGQGWDFNYNRRLVVETNGNVLCVNGGGRVDRYVFNTNGTFTSPAGFFSQLTTNAAGIYRERDRHGLTNTYSATNILGIAKLSSISDRNGNQMTFQYNAVGQLTNTVDTLGRSIVYAYDANGRLTSVTDFAGRTRGFTYDSMGDLTSMTTPAVTGTPNGNDFPSGKTTVYTYSSGFADPRFNHNLLTVTAPNEVAVGGLAWLVAQYDTNSVSTNADRLVSLTLGGTNATGIAAGGQITFGYASFGAVSSTDYATPAFQNTVTNRNGNVTEYRFNQLGNVVREVQFTHGIRVGPPITYTNIFSYNGDGLMITQTNAELSVVQFTYDSGNSNRLAQGNLLKQSRLSGPRGGDQAQITVTNSYETNFNFIATSADGRTNTMTFKYDSRGNRTNVVHRLPSIVEDYTYNSSGQMTSHTLPENGSGFRRTDVMTYYSSGPQTGYLQQSVGDSGGFNLANSYSYDSSGNATNIVDARGSNTVYIVNSLNQVVRSLSRTVGTTNGLVRYQTDYSYDSSDNLIRTDVKNIDDGGNLIAALPNFTTTNVFDILNAPLSTVQQVTTNRFITTSYQYDSNGNRTLVRSGVATSGLQTNNTVSTTFDERDLVYQEIMAPNDPNHSTTQMDYDGDGQLVRRSQGTESSPRITTYTYDGFDRETASTNAMGNVTTTHYDANGNRVSARVDGELFDVPGSASNVRLSESVFTYDVEDRLTKSDASFFDTATQAAIGSGHAITSIAYSGTSQVITNIDANTNVFITKYDTANRLLVTTDAKTNTVTYTYDSNNNVIKTAEVDLSDLGSPAQTIQTTNSYDGLNRLIQTVDAIGITNKFAYDSRGDRVLTTDGRGSVIRYTYDGLNRLTATTRFLSTGGQAITSQTFDDSSRLTAQTDDNTNTTTYVYDPLNRQVRTVFADGTTNGVVYDVHHNQTSTADPKGSVVIADYDLGNRPMSKAVNRGAGVVGTTVETYQYDGVSRIVNAADDDSIVTRSYNSFSQALRETLQALPVGAMQTVSNVYDSVGNRLSCTYPGGRLVNSIYDKLNRLQTVTNSAGLIAAYSYVGPWLVAQRDYGNGTRMLMGYDSIRRLIYDFHLVISSNTNIESRSYTWDASHNQTAMTDQLALLLDARTFRYNSLNQLTQSVTAVVGPTNIYNLDHVGNRLSVVSNGVAGIYTMSNTLPQPADFQMNQYSTTPFDARLYDANGNLTNAGPQRFAYDYRNRLVSYTNTSSGVAATYKYDPFGRRVEKAVSGITNRYAYAGWQEIEEQNSTNATVATYVYGNGIDELLTMDRGGQRRFFHEDSLGSIRKVTDNTGAIVEQYRYNDYGQPTFLNGAGAVIPSTQITNATLFTGRRYDAETGLYYYRTRYLDSAAGRFTTRDSVGIWQDAVNLGNGYTYIGNRPASGTDPSGKVFHGNWCGDGNNKDSNQKDLPPIDALDTCCQTHDKCYDKYGLFGPWAVFAFDPHARSCDFDLVKCAAKVDCTKSYVSKVRCMKDKTLVIGGFSADILVSPVSSPVTDAVKSFVILYNWLFGDGGGSSGGGGGCNSSDVGSPETLITDGYYGCFVEGTLVHTLDGVKAIQDLQIGDYIISYNIKEYKIEPKRVTNLHRERRVDLVQLTVGTNVITCSRNHRFYTFAQEWTEAQKLTGQDRLMRLEGEGAKLADCVFEMVKALQREPVTVYDLDVEDNHDYFVGPSGVLCHNKYNVGDSRFKVPDFGGSFGRGVVGVGFPSTSRNGNPNTIEMGFWESIGGSGPAGGGKRFRKFQDTATTRAILPAAQ